MEMQNKGHWSTSYGSSYAESGSNIRYPQSHLQYPQVVRSPAPDPTPGLQKLKTFGLVQAVLGLITAVVGGVLLGYAAENIGFPTFNFGPLLVGIISLIGGGLGFYGAVDSLRRSHVQKGYVVANFVLNVTNISLSFISAVFAYLSGAVCAGADIAFYNRRYGGERIDVKQYCYPNKSEITTLSFMAAVLCTLLGIWCIMGTCIFCCFGRSFGFQRRRM